MYWKLYDKYGEACLIKKRFTNELNIRLFLRARVEESPLKHYNFPAKKKFRVQQSVKMVM